MAEWLKDAEMMKELEKEQIKMQVDILKKQEGITRSNISVSIKELKEYTDEKEKTDPLVHKAGKGDDVWAQKSGGGGCNLM